MVGLENVYHAVYCSGAELTGMFAPSHKTKSLSFTAEDAAAPQVAAALHQPEARVLLKQIWAGTCVAQYVSEKSVKFFFIELVGAGASVSFLRLEKRGEKP